MHRYVLAAALLTITACKKENPAYCDESPTPADCPAPDGGGGCTADEDCPGQVCDVPSATCVQCTTSNPAACTAATPVCDADDHACRGCTAHSECASNACLPDGTCAAEAQVAYVATNGTSNDCTRTAPCGPLATALATSKPVIKIESSPVKGADALVVDGKTVTIIAEPGATLDRDGDGSILELHNAANVRIADLRITGASGQATDAAILLITGTPQLALTRVKIDTNVGPGISSSGGALTVTQSTVSGNQGAGISSSGGALTVTQSTVSGNQGGGISVANGATFQITNNFIFRNGNASSTAYGGVSLGGEGSGSVFSFNTIVDNQAKTGSFNSGGAVCTIVGFSGSNNIIAHNLVNGDAALGTANTNGDCMHMTSGISQSLASFAFVSPDLEPYDYRLGPGSSAIDQATTASSIAVDVDGDARPQGAQKDQGADEYKP